MFAMRSRWRSASTRKRRSRSAAPSSVSVVPASGVAHSRAVLRRTGCSRYLSHSILTRFNLIVTISPHADRAPVRALAAEAIGTFALVFAGCGAVMVNQQTGSPGHAGVAITFGLVIMAMVYALGHISGAHLNPAVSLAFALTRRFPWPRALGYWVAQVLGAIAAAALLRASLGN